MSNEEFEEMFGNIPFGTMIIIRDWVNKHYVPKDKIRNEIKELEELPQNQYIHLSGVIDKFKELLGE